MGFLDKLFGKKQEVSPGGSTIYRYDELKDEGLRTPTRIGIYAEEVEAHFEALFPGRESRVLHEIVSDLIHVDIHVMWPTEKEPFFVVYTTGMSDLPMNLPEELSDREDLKYAELYMLLPGNWDLGEVGANTKDLPHERFWPIQMLKFLARFPHEYKTWLGWGHTIPNGPDYTPICDGLGFGGAVLDSLSLVPPLTTEEGKEIRFYLLIPAYKEEIEFKLKYGMERLSQRFADGKLPVVLDIHRPNFCEDFKEILD